MIKQHGSWWKDGRIPALIARKQVDGFMFGHGFEIPLEFRADFAEQDGSLLAVGESRPVRLLHQSGDTVATYEARLEHWRIAVPSGKSSLEIRYDSNKELKTFLRSTFSYTYTEVRQWFARFIRQQGGEGQEAEASGDGKAKQPAESSSSERTSGNRRIPPRGSVEPTAVRNPFDTADAYLPREEQAEYIYLYRTDTPFTYRIELQTKSEGIRTQAPLYLAEAGAEYAINATEAGDDSEKESAAMNIPAIPSLPHLADSDIRAAITEISAYIRQRGFSFPDGLVEHFYLSLKTRPFVILAGISGTGKTQLARLFAEALGSTPDNGRFTLIPVRPDWNDPADLIGYKDLSGAFKPGPLTLALKEASRPEHAYHPYFIVLDEMNLARVEHYFSDVLSLMETRKRFVPQEGNQPSESSKVGDIVTQPLLPESSLERVQDRALYGNLYIPGNVYMVGTVNMDETTYPFSKKVLDRAGTIEFNHIDLMRLPELFAEVQQEAEVVAADRHLLGSEYLQLIDAMEHHSPLIRRTSEELATINTLLEDIQAHIGFRVRDSVCFYLIYNERFNLMSRAEAFDAQLMQKILPRIQGSRFSVKKVLLDLLRHCLGSEAEKVFDWRELEDSAESVYAGRRSKEALAAARYPQSARKIAYMLRRLDEDGFTSYWLS
ncbi:McrB family protein [Saccharibacillus sp. JS10]|uniref:McrB family protein n=1 Tax=Saccharibacillus sp. JS10 TaxID=2950552 RepID=UPI00210F03A2|nr:AAA family ATPase [Saccharibacillus sp. JS10]MCQ4086578.1 AAA family ATPase [Saccharibacillus sp. JS10]